MYHVSADECASKADVFFVSLFHRVYSADVLTEITDMDDELPHTQSSRFNPYRESRLYMTHTHTHKNV